MSQQLQNFIYELHHYASQVHILKDTFEKLSHEEQEKVMGVASADQSTPLEVQKRVFQWLDNIQKNQHKL